MRDPVAFAQLWAALVHGAAAQDRGGAAALAWILGTSEKTVSVYRRRVPHAITPHLAAAIRRAPLMLARYDTPLERLLALISDALGADDGDTRHAMPPRRAARWLPSVTDDDTLARLPDALAARLKRTGGEGISDATWAQLEPRTWYCAPLGLRAALRLAVRGRGILLEQPVGDDTIAVLWLAPARP